MPRPIQGRVNVALARIVTAAPILGRIWGKFARVPVHASVPWVPVEKPLQESRVCLVTTGGIHLKTDAPFDMVDPEGDPTYRVIPAAATPAELTITHDYYDHRDADRDCNIVFPLERLRELAERGYLGALHPNHYSFMGHIDGRHVDALQREVLPSLLRDLQAATPDFVLLTPA